MCTINQRQSYWLHSFLHYYFLLIQNHIEVAARLWQLLLAQTWPSFRLFWTDGSCRIIAAEISANVTMMVTWLPIKAWEFNGISQDINTKGIGQTVKHNYDDNSCTSSRWVHIFETLKNSKDKEQVCLDRHQHLCIQMQQHRIQLRQWDHLRNHTPLAASDHIHSPWLPWQKARGLQCSVQECPSWDNRKNCKCVSLLPHRIYDVSSRLTLPLLQHHHRFWRTYRMMEMLFWSHHPEGPMCWRLIWSYLLH